MISLQCIFVFHTIGNQANCSCLFHLPPIEKKNWGCSGYIFTKFMAIWKDHTMQVLYVFFFLAVFLFKIRFSFSPLSFHLLFFASCLHTYGCFFYFQLLYLFHARQTNHMRSEFFSHFHFWDKTEVYKFWLFLCIFWCCCFIFFFLFSYLNMCVWVLFFPHAFKTRREKKNTQ